MMFDDPAESPNLPGVDRRVGMVSGAFERESFEVGVWMSASEPDGVVEDIERSERLRGGQEVEDSSFRWLVVVVWLDGETSEFLEASAESDDTAVVIVGDLADREVH